MKSAETIRREHNLGTYTALGYRAARMSTSDGISATTASGDTHSRYDRRQLVNQSRSFLRDNAIYKGMIERAVAYIVGGGFTLDVQTKSERYNNDCKDLWDRYDRRPEVRGLLSGRQVARMLCRELLVCGDAGVILTDKGTIQLVESELIYGKGGVTDGITKDKYGAPQYYHICQWGNGGPNLSTEQKIDPAYFLFLTDPERPSSTRAVPPGQAAFPMLHRINDVCDSEAISWQLLSRLALAITRLDAAQSAYDTSRSDEALEADSEGHLATRIHDVNYAMMFHAEPGEEIKGIDRNIPGKDFSASIRMFLRLLGLPFGLPLELVLLDWTQSNYSQSRAVLEQAFQTFAGWQEILEDHYYRPVYEWKRRQWIADGLLNDRRDGDRHEWIKPTFPWIDQLKEAQAYERRVALAFATHGQVCKSVGQDRDDVVNARQQEITDAIGRAQQITEQTGQEVPWQLFAGLDVGAGGGNGKQQTPPPQETDEPEEPDDRQEENDE